MHSKQKVSILIIHLILNLCLGSKFECLESALLSMTIIAQDLQQTKELQIPKRQGQFTPIWRLQRRFSVSHASFFCCHIATNNNYWNLCKIQVCFLDHVTVYYILRLFTPIILLNFKDISMITKHSSSDHWNYTYWSLNKTINKNIYYDF